MGFLNKLFPSYSEREIKRIIPVVDKIEAMAVDAMKSANVLVNPRQTGLKDIIELYKKAY
jgi:alcohol dehydrogenase class IV